MENKELYTCKQVRYKLTYPLTHPVITGQINYIGGCYTVPLDVHSDARGFLMELVNERNSGCAMVYHSFTEPHVPRDADRWHLHKIQTDRFFITEGSCVFAISDGKILQYVNMARGGFLLFHIPPGVYHAFLARPSGVGLINIPTHPYNPQDELRVPFVELGVVPWIPIES